ncbi:hypothetical protein [Streptomyces sp. Caat 7-52]|uniref:hypothetical protein n=1 Tax=Streptomyces sp. Caat 7-52 TaxID=2949637 RepID=UPI0020354734|nr:hypothetical protein [Streptomyces sp. Caat 7-52]
MQVVEGVEEVRVQVLRGGVDPGLGCVVEGGPAGLSGQAGQPVLDTAPAQGFGYGFGERGGLGQVAFAECRCDRDDRQSWFDPARRP